MYYVLENLTAYTSYEFRLYSQNRLGSIDELTLTIVTKGIYIQILPYV